MEYRSFGKTGKKISVITLGGMRYKNAGKKPKEELLPESIDNCMTITQKAFKVGINHIETAYGYGKSEHLYGKVLKELGVKRNNFYLMTKGIASSAEEMKGIFEKQLQALQTDRIDFYGLHGINNSDILKNTIKNEGAYEYLAKMKEQGVIGHIGFSTHAKLPVIFEILQTDLFEFMNLHYYYFFQRHSSAIELASIKGVGVFIISPNEKGGMLFRASQKVKEACLPLSPIQFNTRFCLSNPNVSTLCFGLNELSHFDELKGMFNNEIYFDSRDQKIKQKMDSYINDIGDDYCTYCEKCLPCPQNINIPEVLRFRNMVEGYDMVDFAKFRYNMFEEKGHWVPGSYANNCNDCGDCLPRCPMKLKIPTLLRNTHELLIKKPL